MLHKIISIVLSFNLILAQSGFCQGAFELNLGQYLGQMNRGLSIDRFRPLHLRYFSYDTATNNFQLLLDKGDDPDIKDEELQDKTKVLMEYFQVGLSLSNDKFWVNLRPDSEDEIIDPLLERTDLGKVMLESDLQLKKDTAAFTSPQSPEGRLYWDKLYQKARELFGSEPANIPTLTRPWIVPGEIIVKETNTSAYICKANMKVMLEEDYLKTTNPISSGQMYTFSDPRMKELNSYSTQLIREMILPKLTKEVNTAKRYASLRQVFFSLVMARWFKERFRGKQGEYPQLIDSQNLEGLTSKEPWSKSFYFNEYKKSFEKGEYNLKEQVSTISGQIIRSYVSGGQQFERMKIDGFTGRLDNRANFLKMFIFSTMITMAGLLLPHSSYGEKLHGNRGGLQIIFEDPRYNVNDVSVEMRKVDSFNRAVQAADIFRSLEHAYKTRPEVVRWDHSSADISSFFDRLSVIHNRDGGTTRIFLGGKILLYHEAPAGPKRKEFTVNKAPEGEDGVIFTIGGKGVIVSLGDSNSIKITRRGDPGGYSFDVEEVKDGAALHRPKVKTYVEIDKRVSEVLKTDRPYIGFQLGRGDDGLPILIIKQYKDTALSLPRIGPDVEFHATNIIGFFANGGSVYALTEGENPGTLQYIVIEKDRHKLWNEKNVPEDVKILFNRKLNPGFSSQSGSSPLTEEGDPIDSWEKANKAGKILYPLARASDYRRRQENDPSISIETDDSFHTQAFLNSLTGMLIRDGGTTKISTFNPIARKSSELLYRNTFRERERMYRIGKTDSGEDAVRLLGENSVIVRTSDGTFKITRTEDGKKFKVEEAKEDESSSPLAVNDEGKSVTFVIGGVNSNEAIDRLEELTGLPITEIEERARPGEYSRAGFLGPNESLKDVLKHDNETVISHGLTHLQLAEPLFKAMQAVISDSREGFFDYNGKKFRVTIQGWRGYQVSIFNDNLRTDSDYTVADMETGKSIGFSGLHPHYIQRYGFYEGREVYKVWEWDSGPYRLEPKDVISLFALMSSSSPILDPSDTKSNPAQSPQTFGGIDFRQMDMLIQPMGSFSGLNFSLPVLSAATLEAMDLDKELEDIRNIVKAGVTPSGERVKEYLAACFQKGKMAEKQDDLLLCLSEIYRLQEEEVMESSPELRESLVIVETGNFVLTS